MRLTLVSEMQLVVGLYLLSGSLRVYSAWNTLAMGAVLGLYGLSVLPMPRTRWSTIGLRPPGSCARLAQAIGLAAIAYAGVGLVEWSLFGATADNWIKGLGQLLAVDQANSSSSILGALVVMGIVIPLTEETFFRGLVQTTLVERHGAVVGIVLTSALWALVHLGNYGLAPFNARVVAGVLPSVFVMGITLGIARLWTGSVLGSAIAQSVSNVGLSIWAVSLMQAEQPGGA